MVDTSGEAIDSSLAVKQLRRQARYVYLTTSLIALSLTVMILFV
jgi:hypothetical protein